MPRIQNRAEWIPWRNSLEYIISYLPRSNLYNISQLNKYYNKLALHPWFWESYKYRNQNKDLLIHQILSCILSKIHKLKVLDLSFWMAIDEENIKLIAPYWVKGNLKELHLDGWEKITDIALANLVSPENNPWEQISIINRTEIQELKSWEIYDQSPIGLELLSLSECRNIHCSGVK